MVGNLCVPAQLSLRCCQASTRRGVGSQTYTQNVVDQRRVQHRAAMQSGECLPGASSRERLEDIKSGWWVLWAAACTGAAGWQLASKSHGALKADCYVGRQEVWGRG